MTSVTNGTGEEPTVSATVKRSAEADEELRETVRSYAEFAATQSRETSHIRMLKSLG